MIKRKHLMKIHHEDVIRFAKWLGLKRIDGMSKRQLASLIMWLLKRREKKSRGLTYG